MKDLNVKIPELGFSPYVFLFFHPVISATARGGAAGGGHGGFGGGGLGGGGGFGGGGGGAR